MKTLLFGILVAAAASTSLCAVQSTSTCTANSYPEVGYPTACLRGVFVTANFWDGPCNEGCWVGYNVLIDVKSQCGEDIADADSFGMPCNSACTIPFLDQGQQVAQITFTCSMCSDEWLPVGG
jgi:hypothetical protein